jgi:hypothetical protein
MDLPRRSQNSLVANAGLPRVRNRWPMGPRNRHHSGMGVRQAPREELQEPEETKEALSSGIGWLKSPIWFRSLVGATSARARTPPRAVPLYADSPARSFPRRRLRSSPRLARGRFHCGHRISPSRRRIRWSSSLQGRSVSLRSDPVKVLFRISIAPTNRCIIPSSPHCENTLNSCAWRFVDP